MPDDLVDSWAAPPRRETGRGARVALTRAVERWMPRAIGPALVAASAMLVAGQLFSAYRVVWPTDSPGQFQLATDDMSVKVGQVIAQPFTAVPVLVVSLPLLVFAGLTHLPPTSRPRVAPLLRHLASLLSGIVALVGVVLLLATAVWTVVTRGEIGSRGDGTMYLSLDPVVTVLTRGGDGLATAVLAGAAGWLLWTRSADVPPAATDAGEDPEAGADEVGTDTPMPPVGAAVAAVLADPAYRLGSVVPGSPAPFVTRGASEPSWQHTDPTVFRRPSAPSDPGPEPTPEDDAAAADPAGLFRRPVR